MLSRRTSQYTLVAAFLLPVAGCEQKSPQTLLERQQARWEADRPERYVVQVCTTPFDDECERVAVDGDAVTAAQTGSPGGRWVSVGDTSDYEEPIARLFEEAGAPPQRCILKRLEFDAELGFVSEYSHECNEHAGHGSEVVCFVEDADSLEACDEFFF